MLIGILADTHNQKERASRAVELLLSEGAEVLAHCGDLGRPDLARLFSARPWYFTLGNHDADDVSRIEAAVKKAGGVNLGWGDSFLLAGKRLGMAHGHLTIDVRRVLATKPDYFFFGHSHIASDQKIDGVRRINPGALFRADRFSVALLNLLTDELRFLPVVP